MRKQANSEDCFICGMENPAGFKLSFHEYPDGTVRSSLKIKTEYQGWPGIVHGGIIASLLDEVTARVFMNDSTGKRLMMTAKLDETGNLLAEADSVFIQAPDETINQMSLNSRQWIMYPDEGEK
jgi:hypothetical protein